VETAVWILVAVVAGAVASQIATSLIRYRRTMRRPWPKVQPRDDWDD
jgi:hypothetical protein